MTEELKILTLEQVLEFHAKNPAREPVEPVAPVAAAYPDIALTTHDGEFVKWEDAEKLRLMLIKIRDAGDWYSSALEFGLGDTNGIDLRAELVALVGGEP